MGRHSADFGDFGTTADLKSSSAPKSPKNYESPTAIPRILEEESQASKSLRGDTIAEAIHTNTQKLDSSIDSKETSAQPKRCPLFSKEATLCHATAGAVSRNDRNNAQAQKVDSRINATNLSKPAKDSRINKNAQNMFSQNAARRQDFAIFDENATNLNEPAKDSRISRLESGFFEPRKDNKTRGLLTQRGDEIRDSSPKAESTSQAKSPQTNIPLIDLHPQYHAYKHELDSAIASVLHSQHFILGKHSKALESELASFVGRRFCITCSSGTSALLLALLALDIGAGDEVITPSFSFIAAAEMVAFLGAKPVFVDICPSTYTLDPAQVARAISPRTKAIIPVSLFGQPYDVGAIAEVARAIPIIEDGAQSFGSKILGEREARSGSFGTLSITSFFPSKPLGGYGDGGAVFCDDERLAHRLYAFRNHGQASKYHHTMLGLNARLDELQCAILRVKLRHFTHELALREQVAARYYALLKPLQSHLALPYTAPDRTSVFAQFCLRVKEPSPTQPTHKPHATLQNADSRGGAMDCHAAAHAAARNDEKSATSAKVDSRISTQTAQNLNDSQAAGFCDDYALNDSKNCGGALRALGQFGGGSYLSGNDYPQIDPIASNCSPKAESPQAQKVDSRTQLRDHITSTLNAHGIATAIHYPTPLHLQECFAYLGYKKGDFPVSEQIAKEIFSIPFSPYLTKAAQKHIAKALYAIIA